MAQDHSPSAHRASNSTYINASVEASTQTCFSFPNEKSLRCYNQASWLEQNKPEVSMPGGDSVLDLKIRLAVMENDLAYKERERKEAVSACGIIARVLGSGYAGGFTDASTKDFKNDEVRSDSEKWKTLEQEVKVLQRENALLWKILDANHAGWKDDQLVDSNNEILHSKVRQRNRDEAGFRNASTKPVPTTAYVDGRELPLSPDAVAEETKAWGQGSDSGTITDPNSPMIPAVVTLHGRKSSQDIGFTSLDDVLGPEESDIPSSLTNITKASQLLEDGPGINDEVKKHMDSMILPENLPPPTILKTGFDLKGGFKGGEYLISPPAEPKTLSYHRRSGNQGSYESPSSSSSNERAMNPSGREFGSPFAGEKGFAGPYRHYSYGGSFGGDLGFFRYGIRYVPSETDSNFMRQIVISNLPKDIEMRDVLAKVRGGDVVSSIMLDTENITGGKSAMVQFLNESSAQEYLAYTKVHPIHFGASSQNAEITLIRTPTWPLTTGPYLSILQYKQTRCLAIPHFPESLSLTVLERHIAGKNPFRAAALLDLYPDDEGTLNFEFSSMVDAQRAYEIITQWRTYAGLRPFFAPDPCAGSVEELSSPLPAGSLSNGETAKTSGVDEEAKEEISVSHPREQKDSDTPTTNPILPVLPEDVNKSTDTTLRAVLIENSNQDMGSKEHGVHKPLVGLAGSQFATIIPGFSVLQVSHKSTQSLLSITAENDTRNSPMGEKALSISVSSPADDVKNESIVGAEVETRDRVYNPDEIVLI